MINFQSAYLKPYLDHVQREKSPETWRLCLVGLLMTRSIGV